MTDQDIEGQEPRKSILPKVIFGFGVGLVAVSGFMMYSTWSAQQPDPALAVTEAAPQVDLASLAAPEAVADQDENPGIISALAGLFSGSVEEVVEAPQRNDQAALPARPDGWRIVNAEGGGQAHVLAKEVYRAMHSPDGPLDVFELVNLAEAQQPNGLMSEAVAGANQAMQVAGASEAEANLQTAVNPLVVQLGDQMARSNDALDQGRVYISGEKVVMVMIRRLPPNFRHKGSWLQITSPGVPVPQEMAGHTYMESARTAGSDEIHALRLDITEDLFIEIGGRVDRETLIGLAEGIDYASL